jgi:hypothetical protein
LKQKKSGQQGSFFQFWLVQFWGNGQVGDDNYLEEIKLPLPEQEI